MQQQHIQNEEYLDHLRSMGSYADFDYLGMDEELLNNQVENVHESNQIERIMANY